MNGFFRDDEHVSARGLVSHLWQILHIDVDVSRLVGLEGFGRREFGRRLGYLFNASAYQEQVQGRPTHRRMDESVYHRKQVVERQARWPAQVDDQLLLPGVQHGLQPIRRVAAVFHRVPVLPALHGGVDAVLRRQFDLGSRGLRDLHPGRRGGGGVLVKLDEHEDRFPQANVVITALRTSRPKSRARPFSGSQIPGA